MLPGNYCWVTPHGPCWNIGVHIQSLYSQFTVLSMWLKEGTQVSDPKAAMQGLVDLLRPHLDSHRGCRWPSH